MPRGRALTGSDVSAVKDPALTFVGVPFSGPAPERQRNCLEKQTTNEKTRAKPLALSPDAGNSSGLIRLKKRHRAVGCEELETCRCCFLFNEDDGKQPEKLQAGRGRGRPSVDDD